MNKHLKTIISVSLNVFLVIALVACLLQIERLSRHNHFHRNKMLQYEYLTLTVNESDKTLQFFKDKWGADFIQQSETYFYVEADAVEKDEFFHDPKKAYDFGGADFQGYDFHFDEQGNLTRYFVTTNR